VLEFSLAEYRCEDNTSTRDALYVAERQEHDQTKQALSKAQERNGELLRKVDDSEKTINKMLENAQRFLSRCHYL
jgi:myosin-5